jgi:hypothetical protein
MVPPAKIKFIGWAIQSAGKVPAFFACIQSLTWCVISVAERPANFRPVRCSIEATALATVSCQVADPGMSVMWLFLARLGGTQNAVFVG